MPRHSQTPSSKFVPISTYKEFSEYVRAFAEGKLNLLVMIARPGVGKSEQVRRALDGKKLLYCNGGQLTPLDFFIEAQQHVNQPIILDDANEIMRHNIGKRLVIALTDTRPLKTVDYRTTNRILEKLGLHTSFKTSSRLCYIANSWLPESAEAKALEDRAHLVWFDPTVIEVHTYAATWFWDADIFDYVGKVLHLIDQHSCRLYYNASEIKRAGGDWRAYILRHCYDRAMSLVRELEHDAQVDEAIKDYCKAHKDQWDDGKQKKLKELEDQKLHPECKTGKERIAKWMSMTNLSRATYFNYRKELGARGQIAEIKPLELPELEPQGEIPAPPPPLEEQDQPPEVVDEEQEEDS